MNSFFELIGPPGSGKSFIYNKIKKNLSKKKIIFSGDEYFFKYYYRIKNKNIKYKLYYQYKKKIKFESNILFNEEYNFLKYEIDLIIKKNRLKKIIDKLKIILSFTELNRGGLRRTLDNFKINLVVHYLKSDKVINVLNDEGLIQCLFQVYKFKLNKKHLKIIENFLKLLPKFKLIFFFKVNRKVLISRTAHRRKGFKYQNNDINLLFKNFDSITKIIKKILKIKKVNYFEINNNTLDDKKLLFLEKKI